MPHNDEFLWVESNRPKTIDECILPKSIKSSLLGFRDSKRIPNLLFSGTAGTGKTTAARALCEEVGVDYIVVNASNESGIDTFRTTIVQFASTISLTDAKKVIILDEFDHATPQMQAALRAGIEAVSSNCTFIFTCNFKNRIITPIHSRCAVIDFKIPSAERVELAAAFFKRVLLILQRHQIEYNQKVVAELVQRYFPDFRRTLNELQRYSAHGKIDSGILVAMDNQTLNELFLILKEKRFSDMRKWIAKNAESYSEQIFRSLYDTAESVLVSESIPDLVLILADYSYKSAFVADQELNLAACMTEIMSTCNFK